MSRIDTLKAAFEAVKNITADYYEPSCRKAFGYGFVLEFRTESAEREWLVEFIETTCSPPFENMKVVCSATDPDPVSAIQKAIDKLP